MIELSDESLTRYVNMINSRDESARDLLLTVLESNFHVKYKALYLYLCYKYKVSSALFLPDDHPQICKLLFKIGYVRTLSVYSTVRLAFTKYESTEDELFSPEAQIVLSRLFADQYSEDLIIADELKAQNITLDVKITIKKKDE